MRIMTLATIALSATLLLACGDDRTRGNTPTPDTGPGDLDAGPTADYESGTYATGFVTTTANDCAFDTEGILAAEYVLTVGAETVRIDPYGVDAQILGSRFDADYRRQINYETDGLDCVVDTRVGLEGRATATAGEIELTFEVEFRPNIVAASGSNADCEDIMAAEFGAASWDQALGCDLTGTARLTKR